MQGLGMRWRRGAVAWLVAVGCGGDDSTPADDTGGDMSVTGDTATVASGEASTSDGATSMGGGTTMVDDSGGSTSDGATGEDTTGAVDHGPLVLLEVIPVNTVLEVDLDTPTVQSFMVKGRYMDGQQEDLTDVAVLQHTNPMVGTINGSDLELPGFPNTYIDTTIITAEVDGITAEAQLTVAAYAQTGAQTDFFFVLPYEDPAGPDDEPLTFSTDVNSLDVFIDMDTTGSMGGPINNLIASLNSTVTPGVQAAVPDTWFGVGAFMDYPISPFGTPGCFSGTTTPYDTDQPFILLQPMTSSLADAQAAVSALSNGASPIGCGSDGPESMIESLYQIATGDGLAGPSPTFVAENHNGIGGVEFREGTLPIIVNITDNQSHDPGVPMCGFGTDYDSNPSVLAVAGTRAQTKVELEGICGRVVTVAVSNFDPSCGPLADGVDFAEATGAMVPPEAWDLAPAGRPPGCAAGQCCTGENGVGVPPNASGQCPMVYRVNFSGTGLGDSMTDGVVMLANYAPFDVTTGVGGVDTDVDGVPLPPGTTTADFIQAVAPLWHGPVPLPGVPDPTLTADSFLDVIPNTPVTFEVQAYNDFIMPTDEAQLFTATISVLADNCRDLDEREVFILVPPASLGPEG